MSFKVLERFLGRTTLPELEVRLNTILPQQYQDCFEEVEPVSMGSAALKYDEAGKVAWDQIWGNFCNLAMAGGPPHKGALLEPGPAEDIALHPGPYREVTEEACRGLRMVTNLAVDITDLPGWIQLFCTTDAMAGWMLRAIAVENVSVRLDGKSLLLPVGPHYRLAKEIKNIVTVVAKTSHYWLNHMSRQQHIAIGSLFDQMNAAWPLLTPAFPTRERDNELAHQLARKMGMAVGESTGLVTTNHNYVGWLGVQCGSVKAAVWIMRALVGTNVLSRREETAVFLPVNAARDADGIETAARLLEVHRLALSRGVV